MAIQQHRGRFIPMSIANGHGRVLNKERNYRTLVLLRSAQNTQWDTHCRRSVTTHRERRKNPAVLTEQPALSCYK